MRGRLKIRSDPEVWAAYFSSDTSRRLGNHGTGHPLAFLPDAADILNYKQAHDFSLKLCVSTVMDLGREFYFLSIVILVRESGIGAVDPVGNIPPDIDRCKDDEQGSPAC